MVATKLFYDCMRYTVLGELVAGGEESNLVCVFEQLLTHWGSQQQRVHQCAYGGSLVRVLEEEAGRRELAASCKEACLEKEASQAKST
jgi:hypothetical protein